MSIYEQGLQAYFAGKDLSDCPYDDMLRSAEWRDGWTDAESSGYEGEEEFGECCVPGCGKPAVQMLGDSDWVLMYPVCDSHYGTDVGSIMDLVHEEEGTRWS